MRIKEPIEKSGYFWLPSQAELKIPGTLKIREPGEIELEVLALSENPFSEAIKNINVERIVGVIEGSQLVTLDDCYLLNIKGGLGSVSKTQFGANCALIGTTYKEGEIVTFSRARFSVEGLDEWLLISGFDVDHNWDTGGAVIAYTPPKMERLKISSDLSIQFSFDWTTPGFPNISEAKITQKAYVSVESATPLSKSEFINLAFKITNFLSFAIDRTVSIDSFSGYSAEIKQETGDGTYYEIPIKVYYKSFPYSETRPKIAWHEMLLPFKSISNTIEIFLKNWIEKYEVYGPAFNLFFTARADAHKYLEGKFLSLAQGIETLHRRQSGQTVMPENEFFEIFNKILEVCPSERREWLKTRLKYSNELSLRNRLKEIIDSFPYLFQDKPKIKHLIDKIVDTRNYLTHYTTELENKAAVGMSLFRLCEKLDCIFQLHFLKEIGMTDEKINLLCKANNSLRKKLPLEIE